MGTGKGKPGNTARGPRHGYDRARENERVKERIRVGSFPRLPIALRGVLVGIDGENSMGADGAYNEKANEDTLQILECGDFDVILIVIFYILVIVVGWYLRRANLCSSGYL